MNLGEEAGLNWNSGTNASCSHCAIIASSEYRR